MTREERDVIDAAQAFGLYLIMIDTEYTIHTDSKAHADGIAERLDRLEDAVTVLANEAKSPNATPDYEKQCGILTKALDGIAYQETERLRGLPKPKHGQMQDITYHRIAVEALQQVGKDVGEFSI